jgi:hypothetical protein
MIVSASCMETNGNRWEHRGTDDERCEMGWKLTISMAGGLLLWAFTLWAAKLLFSVF